MSDSFYKRFLKEASRKSRRQKFELLESVFRPRPSDLILDVGADPQMFSRYTFEDFYPFPDRIVGGGIDLALVESARRSYPQPRYAVFDGCALPFPDKSFDLVFSNAVIEHVTGDRRQERFAQEAMRVGKSWFVTTPNYWFPLEVHYHLPFIQFLPRALQGAYNRLLGTSIAKDVVLDLDLLSARRLGRLFPGSSIVKMKVTLWPETLVAYRIDPARRAY